LPLVPSIKYSIIENSLESAITDPESDNSPIQIWDELNSTVPEGKLGDIVPRVNFKNLN